MKKANRVQIILSCVSVLVLLIAVFASCSDSQPAESSGAAAPVSGDVRSVEPREDALTTGKPITPEALTAEYFYGLDEVGVIPEKKYFIAFSNGEIGNSWSRALVNDMDAVGKRYNEEFGIRFEWTNAGNDSTKQLSDIQSLLAKKPDVLVIDPNETEPLAVVYDWCKDAGVPLITFDKELNVETDDTYICKIGQDNYLTGICQGFAIADFITQKNGEPKGNVAEVAGILGATPSVYRSQGANYALQQFPDIHIVASRAGEWDNTICYQVAQDILTTYPAGSLDAVLGSCDDGNLVFMEAAASAGRTDLAGSYVGADSPVAMLEKILAGEAYFSAEITPLFSHFIFEYAINYLNGKDIPAIVPVPQRFFTAETEEKREALKEIIETCKANGDDFVPLGLGYFDLFNRANDERVKEIYPYNIWDPRAATEGKYFDVPYYATSK